LIGSTPRELGDYGIHLRPRVVAASDRTVSFVDGAIVHADSVIWATGYRSDYSWIDLPVVNTNGQPQHRRGVTDVPGLYFLGLTWQHTRGSALIGFVKDDAEFIAQRIADLRTATPADAGTADGAAASLVRSSERI
jgi:putative flavoprotein involved in K+ transport